MCICVALVEHYNNNNKYVYMHSVEHYNNNNKVCVYVLPRGMHYNNNNKVCVYVLPCGAL